jgi:hypothetical protein
MMEPASELPGDDEAAVVAPQQAGAAVAVVVAGVLDGVVGGAHPDVVVADLGSAIELPGDDLAGNVPPPMWPLLPSPLKPPVPTMRQSVDSLHGVAGSFTPPPAVR